jgi:hypothetical protein
MSETFVSAVPAAIRQRAAAADELLKATNTQQAPAPDQGGSEGAGSEPPSAQADPTDAGGAGSQPEPVMAAPPSDAPAPQAPDAETELRARLARMEQELKTWRGRYEAELPRERDARMTLEEEIRKLRDRMAEPPKVEDSGITPPTSEELENYGKDIFDVARRYIMPEIVRMNAELERRLIARIEAVSSDVGAAKQQVTKTAKDRFVERLTSKVPNWQQVDIAPEFGAWLDEVDPLYGLPRRAALDKAVGTLDDDHVARIFTAFLNQQGPGESQGTKAPIPAPAAGTEQTATAPQPASGPSLADLAAPGKPTPSSQASEPTQPGAKIWLMSEIRDFYKAVARGDWRNRPDEKARKEAEIAQAQRDRRVRADSP